MTNRKYCVFKPLSFLLPESGPNEPKKTISFDELELVGQKAALEKIHQCSNKYVNANQVTNIPARYRDAKLLSTKLSLEISKNLSSQYIVAKKYVNQFAKSKTDHKRNMFFFGGVGSGKTYAACAVSNALAEIGCSVLYTTSAEITAEIAATKSFSSKENELLAIRKFLDPDLLVIDEIKQLNALESQLFFNVIDLRYRNNKPMLGVSNWTPERLGLAIGEMTLSRIIGHGAEIVHFDYEDLRLLNFKNNKCQSVHEKGIPCYDESSSLFNLE